MSLLTAGNNPYRNLDLMTKYINVDYKIHDEQPVELVSSL